MFQNLWHLFKMTHSWAPVQHIEQDFLRWNLDFYHVPRGFLGPEVFDAHTAVPPQTKQKYGPRLVYNSLLLCQAGRQCSIEILSPTAGEVSFSEWFCVLTE